MALLEQEQGGIALGMAVGLRGPRGGQKRSNETHQSTTDPESRLYRKSCGKESKLAYLNHALND